MVDCYDFIGSIRIAGDFHCFSNLEIIGFSGVIDTIYNRVLFYGAMKLRSSAE